MTLYLIRHGQTAHNRDALGLGRDDVPLTPFGEQQAAALSGRLSGVRFNRVFCSPLKRAARTAELAVGGAQVEIREALTEMDVGETEGMTYPEMRVRFPEFLARWAGDDCDLVRMPGGESLADVAVRLQEFIAELRSLDSEEVAVVSHNFVLKVLLCELLDFPLPKFRVFTLGVASLSTIGGSGTRRTIESLNDTCHLSHLEP